MLVVYVVCLSGRQVEGDNTVPLLNTPLGYTKLAAVTEQFTLKFTQNCYCYYVTHSVYCIQKLVKQVLTVLIQNRAVQDILACILIQRILDVYLIKKSHYDVMYNNIFLPIKCFFFIIYRQIRYTPYLLAHMASYTRFMKVVRKLIINYN